MGLQTLTLSGSPGLSYVQYASIAYSTILNVKREGMSYNIITTGMPQSNQVLYTASTGTLTFSYPFSGSGSNDNLNEKVYILFK